MAEHDVNSGPAAGAAPSPFVDLSRTEWSQLRNQTPLPLTGDELEELRGLGDEVDLDEVSDIYLPLSRLLNLHVRGTAGLHEATTTFLGSFPERTPYVIGIAGSVAVGKSTTARLLRLLLARWPEHPQVELITTDGFLLPNAELERRQLLQRKGFPESYDRRALLRFVASVKSGAAEVRAPSYSHLTYDVVPDEEVVVRRPDIVLIEGLNVLQPARPRGNGVAGLAVSDFFDFSIYLDAAQEHIRDWYIDRFLRLRETAFRRPESYFHRYADLDHDAAVARAAHLWDSINGPNLDRNIQPTRSRAKLVLTKDSSHAVQRIRLRKI
ncbi:type I pantothenate kinase [Phytoactinopolyspora limicola]|uniref:type I pantothenate kinase n=1 Tax=Phytoactinopolyspora limicola TaxID=2715536 RepID=UPI00140E7452|nr:type I pantothenate kinase [Phytoactinopolyspora limicola]